MTATHNDPINPLTIDKLSDDELDALLAQRRERRLASFKVYQETQEIKREVRSDKLRTMIEKELKMFAKELDRVDSGLEKLEKRVLKIRGVRLELEDM